MQKCQACLSSRAQLKFALDEICSASWNIVPRIYINITYLLNYIRDETSKA